MGVSMLLGAGLGGAVCGGAAAILVSSRPRLVSFFCLVGLVISLGIGPLLNVVLGVYGQALVFFASAASISAWTIAAPRLTSAIIWSFVAAMMLSSAALLKIPGNLLDVGFGIALAVSVIWVAFQFWCYWDKHSWRVATSLILVTAVSGYVVFTTPPPF